jgi:hypothetical protein
MIVPILLQWSDGTESFGMIEKPDNIEQMEGAFGMMVADDTDIPVEAPVGDVFHHLHLSRVKSEVH